MKISNKLRNNINHLKILGEIKNKQLREKCLNDLSNKKEICDCLSEICFNIAKGNIQLGSREKKKLRKFQRLIFSFAKKTKSHQKNIKQTGGFLPYLLPIISSLAADIVLKKFTK